MSGAGATAMSHCGGLNMSRRCREGSLFRRDEQIEINYSCLKGIGK